MGVVVLASANHHSANLIRDEWFGKPYPSGLYRTVCRLPGTLLNEGRYRINVIILTDVTHHEVFESEALTFGVYDTGAMRQEFGGTWIGVIRPRLAWQTERLAALDTTLSKEKSL